MQLVHLAPRVDDTLERRNVPVVAATRGGHVTIGHEPVIAHNVSDAMLKAVDLLPSLFIFSKLLERQLWPHGFLNKN